MISVIPMKINCPVIFFYFCAQYLTSLRHIDGYICQWTGSSWVQGMVCCFLNTSRLRQNGCHFTDDNFECIFFKENAWISIKIWLKFNLKGPINNIPALVQIMTWQRSGDKPLSEPMMISLLTHICVTWPQWVNAKLLPKPIITFFQVDAMK